MYRAAPGGVTPGKKAARKMLPVGETTFCQGKGFKGMPGMPFPASFVNPTLHASHLEAIATDQAAAAQAQLMNKSYPGFLSAIAKNVSAGAAVVPPTGLVHSSKASGKRTVGFANPGPSSPPPPKVL